MIQNDTKTFTSVTSDAVHTARRAVSRPVVAHALGLLLGLGLVAGCGDDGGDTIFSSDDAGADASLDSGNTTTDESSTEDTTTESSEETSTGVSPVTSGDPTTDETETTGTSDETSVDTSAITDPGSSSDVTSTTDVSSTDVSSSDLSSTDLSSTTDVSSSTDSSDDTTTDSSDESTADASTDVTLDLDGGVDATDTTELDSSIASDDSSPDATDTDTSDTSAPDASSDTDSTETTEPSDASDTTVVTDELDASDGGGPVLLTGVGPVIPDPAVDIATSGQIDAAHGDGIDDALFTATIVAPVSKLVLVNTELNGEPHFADTGGGGGYYTYWTTSNPIPSEVPVITADTPYNIHTVESGSFDPLAIPLLGVEGEVEFDMYVSFGEDPRRTPYYRLYVFGADDELTQVVDFAPQSDAGTSDAGN